MTTDKGGRIRTSDGKYESQKWFESMYPDPNPNVLQRFILLCSGGNIGWNHGFYHQQRTPNVSWKQGFYNQEGTTIFVDNKDFTCNQWKTAFYLYYFTIEMPSAKKDIACKRKQTVNYALAFRNPMVAAHDSIVVAYVSTIVERDSTVLARDSTMGARIRS